jgi:cytochrome bd ubiquinol oxidase subunit I
MNLTYGRILMGTSLGLHIILAVIGMALPLYISLAEGLGIWQHNDALRLLARRWTAAFVILFAVGAATGMIVGIELSLLWPNFMAVAGQAIALPFAVETFAFFFEAIFLGLYVYGWDRFTNPWLHWLCSLPIVVGAAASGSLITIVNAWMNSPAGFTLVNGKVTNVQPIKAVLNPAMPTEVAHTVVTAYLAVGFMLAGITAVMMLRGRRGQYYLEAGDVGLVGGGLWRDTNGRHVGQIRGAVPTRQARRAGGALSDPDERTRDHRWHRRSRAPYRAWRHRDPVLPQLLGDGRCAWQSGGA